VLLATSTLLLAAPAAQAAVSVTLKVAPVEGRWGTSTKISGTVLDDGAPFAGQTVQLDGKRYPYEDPLAPLDTTTTANDGTFSFERALDRNWQFRVIAVGEKSDRVRAYVYPATTLTFRARSRNVIKLTQRYRVPRDVRLDRPTIFYIGRRGRATAPRAATAELERVRAGRYGSTAVVRLPTAWHGRFRYASCFRYTGGSGMGNPRVGCPRRFKF
jgi:hypothetical protein